MARQGKCPTCRQEYDYSHDRPLGAVQCPVCHVPLQRTAKAMGGMNAARFKPLDTRQVPVQTRRHNYS